MGLFGTQGVLPFFYTEWMLQRQALKDTAMAAFLDLFNHRWLSLFYRAWEKHRLPVAIERNLPDVSRSSRIGECIFDISGLGTGGIRKRMRVSDFAVAHYAGLLAQRSRSAMGLQCLLRDYFGFPVEILQFCGAWHRLDQGDRCYLNAPGISNQLGVGAALGDSVWDTQSAFEIRVGPLRYSDFRSFLPGGTAAQEMSDLVTLFAGRAQGFRIRLVLSGSEVPYPQLDPEGSSPRLGWDFWLRDRSACGDRADTVFAEAA